MGSKGFLSFSWGFRRVNTGLVTLENIQIKSLTFHSKNMLCFNIKDIPGVSKECILEALKY